MRKEMMCDRGMEVDHSTLSRWVQKYAPQLGKRCRPHMKLANHSWRVDEAYPSSVTFRKHLPFLNSRAFVYEAIASFFSNNKYSHQVFLIE
jgi:hypothetical protein